MYLVDFDRNYDILVGEKTNLDVNGYVQADSLYDMFKLIPEEGFGIEPPEVRSESIDIPGAMGSRSLVNFLTGYPVFTNRQGNLSFISFEHDPNRMSRIYRMFHGRELNLVMPNRQDYFYTGMFEVTKYSIESDNVEVELQYNLQPYLFSRDLSNLILTDETETELIIVDENTQPYMPIIRLETETPEYPTQLIFKNEELQINSTVTLQPGINHLGTQVIISKFDVNNTNTFKLIQNGGNSKVTVEYRHCML